MTSQKNVVDFSNLQTAWRQTSPQSWALASYSINPQREIADLRNRLAEAERQAQIWEHIANTDSLTGLYSRFKLDSLNSCFNDNPNQHRQKNPSTTLLFIDLDDFGQLNKLYNDSVGDEALRVLGAAIQKIIREDDLAIRKGGDEFVILLRGADVNAANNTVVKRLQDLLSGGLEIEYEGKKIPIRGSIGVFTYNPALSPLQNIQEADVVMREVKKERKREKEYATEPGQYHYSLHLPGFEPSGPKP